MSINRFLFVIVFLFNFLLPIFLKAQAGSLDYSFGYGGIVTTDFGYGDDEGRFITVQSDNKIIVAGWAYNGSDNDFAIARYNTDGSLDVSFSDDGKVTTDFGGDDYCYSAAIQSDGKILLSGRSYIGSIDIIALLRYNNDGTLDNTFGINGKLTTQIGNNEDVGWSVKIQNDGKIIVSGESYTVTDDIALLRYNSNGELDTSFGNNGIVLMPVGNFGDWGISAIVQSDNKIIVAGHSGYNENQYHFSMSRFKSNGDIDSAFGFNGKIITPISSINDEGYLSALQQDGKIVESGWTNNGNNYDIALVRHNSDGTLDNSFGSGGIVTTDFEGNNDVGFSVAVQSDGKILVTGYKNTSTNEATDFALLRYNSDGSLDNSFGTNGKTVTTITSSYDESFSIAIQNDSKIITAGYSYLGNNEDFALVRYNGDSSGTSNTIPYAVSIYPNPSRDKILVKTIISGATEINFFDLAGRKFFSELLFSNNQQINISSLSQGIYVYEIKIKGGESLRGKLVKE